MRSRFSRWRGRRSQDGVVAVWVAIAATVIFGIGAFAVDVARWYVEAERLQKTVDSAATSGVVYLPGDVSSGYDTALDIAQRNGWTVDGTDVTFDARQVEDRPTRLRVTMSSEVDNTFGRVLGVDTTRLSRTAVADYGAPAAVGNPCNVYGNQEMEDPADRVDGSNCVANSGYWLNIAGDNTNKARGDGYGSGWCTKPDVTGGTIDNCHSVNAVSGAEGINADHSTAAGEKTFPGYVFNVRAAESGTLRLSGYDLGWVATGDHCTAGNLLGSTDDERYGWGRTKDGTLEGQRDSRGTDTDAHKYCAGDTEMSFPEGDRSTVETTITVRRPSPNPWQPLAGEVYCSYTLGGWDTGTPASALASDADLSRTFHRWSGLCGEDDLTSIPVQAGDDWVVQVETSGPGGVRGGGGQNRFALRAELGAGGGDKVNVYAVDKFSIFVNDDIDTSGFNIIRLDSSTAGKALELGIFDIGDAAEVTAQIMKPDGTPFADCDFDEDRVNNAQPDVCRFTTQASTSGGYWITMQAPIPDDYECGDDSDFTQCWVSLKIDTAKSQDTTTWTARVVGDPVRIVE